MLQLDKKHRESVYLYFYEQKSYDEIADIVWSNKNTVWTIISQWKKRIKEIIIRNWLENVLYD
jgi:DNA-directed RNA polymerase specialized sigma24 family protein